MVKLIVHIGHGKTGSSSIQETLLAGRSTLADQGVVYLGLMLEHGGNTPQLDWQQKSGSDVFFAPGRDPVKANAELFEVLSITLARLDAEGTSRAIWSNEWLAQRAQMVIPALEQIVTLGHEVEIQCYVRRHDKWAISAYSQWGVKHKTYPGPVREFEAWIPGFGGRNMRFADDLEPWNAAFKANLHVFNFDQAGNVVEHFLGVNGITGVVPVNDNISPSAVEIAAQAVFNSRRNEPVLPSEYDRVRSLLRRETANVPTLIPIDKLFPSPETLNDILENRSDDIKRLNELLLRSDQPKLDFSSPPQGIKHPSPWEMDQYLLRLVFGLTEEVQELRQQIAGLKLQHQERP